MANAPVLPEPVCARPMTSLPAGESDGVEGAKSIISADVHVKTKEKLTCKQMRDCLLLYAGGRLPSQANSGLCKLPADSELLEECDGVRCCWLLAHHARCSFPFRELV